LADKSIAPAFRKQLPKNCATQQYSCRSGGCGTLLELMRGFTIRRLME
jgi:hypothetical protein